MRMLSTISVPAFILAMALSASAQEKPVTTTKEMTDTVKVTVTGQVILDYVWRSNEITAFASPTGQVGAGSNSENTFEGSLAIRLNVDLSDKVSAVIEIGRERVDDGFIPFNGAEQLVFADVVIREMHVNIAEFLTPELRMQVGITTWSFDVRGRGNSFAFDPRHSQAFSRNANSPLEDDAGELLGKTSAPDELDPIGAWFRYQRDALALDFVFLPMVVEGGAASDDEALYAVDVWYNIDNKGSRVGAILALVSIPGIETSIFTLGGGVVLNGLVEDLELYAEVYFQFGDAGEFGVPPDTMDAGGLAFQVGAQYAFKSDIKPWVGLNLTLISGDGDDIATSSDDTVDRFMSYENINDLMILEDMYFGFDIDSNYFAIKISGGAALSIGQAKNNLELSAILGIVRANEDFAVGTSGEDALGTEFDVKARWILTKQASLNAAIGLLFGSKVLEEGMQDLGKSDESGNAILYTFGADLRF